MMNPVGATLISWASSLIIDFPTDNIPILRNENEWKRWGDMLVQETTFANNGAPGTLMYNDWKTWAYAIGKPWLIFNWDRTSL